MQRAVAAAFVLIAGCATPAFEADAAKVDPRQTISEICYSGGVSGYAWVSLTPKKYPFDVQTNRNVFLTAASGVQYVVVHPIKCGLNWNGRSPDLPDSGCIRVGEYVRATEWPLDMASPGLCQVEGIYRWRN